VGKVSRELFFGKLSRELFFVLATGGFAHSSFPLLKRTGRSKELFFPLLKRTGGSKELSFVLVTCGFAHSQRDLMEQHEMRPVK